MALARLFARRRAYTKARQFLAPLITKLVNRFEIADLAEAKPMLNCLGK
jgi:hypothetical protein